jgi:hypothetical protein
MLGSVLNSANMLGKIPAEFSEGWADDC